MDEIVRAFDQGKLLSERGERNAADLPWEPNPRFPGVSLKHLLTGADTGGRFSVHLVRVEAGHEIGLHIHATQFELHEVLSGRGWCEFMGQRIPYSPGRCLVVPEGVEHRVVADAEGDLYLSATFVPPLK